MLKQNFDIGPPAQGCSSSSSLLLSCFSVFSSIFPGVCKATLSNIYRNSALKLELTMNDSLWLWLLPRFFEVITVTEMRNIATVGNTTLLQEVVTYDITDLRMDPTYIRCNLFPPKVTEPDFSGSTSTGHDWCSLACCLSSSSSSSTIRSSGESGVCNCI